jgi:primosomal replication protein N
MATEEIFPPLNRVQFVGRVVSEPIGRITKTGKKMGAVVIEVPTSTKSEGGMPCSVRVVGCGESADRIVTLSVGQQVRIKGRLELDTEGTGTWRSIHVHARFVDTEQPEAAAKGGE